jgi:hypothetical protein
MGFTCEQRTEPLEARLHAQLGTSGTTQRDVSCLARKYNNWINLIIFGDAGKVA